MSTPEQPSGPGLTRKQMREIRMTGATPIVSPDTILDEPAGDVGEPAAEEVVPPTPADPPVAPLPRAAEPVAAPAPPIPDAQVDLGVAPLTRRQAREQERIRTASVPVITPDVLAAVPAPAPPATDSPWAAPAPEDSAAAPEDAVDAASTAVESVAAGDAPRDGEVPAEEGEESSALPVPAFAPVSAAERPSETADAAPVDAAPVDEAVEPTAPVEPETEETVDEVPRPEEAVVAAGVPMMDAAPQADTSSSDERPLLRPEFGSSLLAGAEASPDNGAPSPSFDELIARGGSATGSLATPNALILTQPASAGPLTSPVAATGEVLITGTFPLPQGLGSQGHADGVADGKEVDSVLIDGELPASSSPTPIAASAAISTVRGPSEELIRPPAPEKGNKLMLGLAITAGVLAVALVGVLIVALVTGVFQ